jgi:formamidopyrimidine-DNA glycosylase
VPELPDLTVYLEALAPRIVGQPVLSVDLRSPFVLRSVSPLIQEVEERRVVGLSRIGKRIVWEMEGGLFVVFHLMVAGRFHWKAKGAKTGGKQVLAVFELPTGNLLLTEASAKRRASIKVFGSAADLAAEDPGGIEPLAADLAEFGAALARGNHTLKRALTDPRLFAGIGNAYSDEILHRARLSPFKRTGDLYPEEVARVYEATRETLALWTDRLRAETGDAFPEKVTAFHEGFAVHGKYGKPCPVCGTPVQRIVYAENEANYCPTCQTGGRLLADRALSQLLKKDWPRTLEELEERKAAARAG